MAHRRRARLLPNRRMAVRRRRVRRLLRHPQRRERRPIPRVVPALRWRRAVGAGGRSRAGRGRRFCDECVRGDAPRPVVVRVKPCHNCGSTAPKPRGHKVCAECAPIVHEAAVARKKARDAMKVLPCAGCGRARRRGTGQGTIYCGPCMEKRAERPRCSVCKERPIRGRAKQLCEECHREAVVRRREYHRLAAGVARRRRSRASATPISRARGCATGSTVSGTARRWSLRRRSSSRGRAPRTASARTPTSSRTCRLRRWRVGLRLIAAEAAGPFVKGDHP
jgi:hypothetical protein